MTFSSIRKKIQVGSVITSKVTVWNGDYNQTFIITKKRANGFFSFIFIASDGHVIADCVSSLEYTNRTVLGFIP